MTTFAVIFTCVAFVGFFVATYFFGRASAFYEMAKEVERLRDGRE